MTIQERIQIAGVIPVIAIDRAEDIIPLCDALGNGGLPVAEITFRTEAGREALRSARRSFPDFLLGAGTVTRIEELEAAAEAGADFAVAPGTNPRIVERAAQLGLPFFPGVCTPTDIELALSLGAKTLKFFPAEAAGGLPMIKALYAPYKHLGISFVPTGGIRAGNLGDYLSTPGVTAVGGTWLATPQLLKERRFDEIERQATDAVVISTARRRAEVEA